MQPVHTGWKRVYCNHPLLSAPYSSVLELAVDDIQLVRGEGQYVYDKNGRKFLDCVNNVTHG